MSVLENNKEEKLPLLKWIMLIILGPVLFLILTGITQGIGSFSNILVIKVILIAGGGIALIFLYALFIRILEKRVVSELKPSQSLAHLGAGFLIGILFIAIIIAILSLIGGYRVDSIQYYPKILLLNFVFCFAIAVGEEIIFRGFLFRMVDKRWNTNAAFIISGLAFGFAHIGQVDLLTAAAISIEAGFMLGAAIKLRNSLWIPIGIHWGWNFALGPIFGIAISGNAAEASFVLPQLTGDVLLTGGQNGLEGSLITVAVGVATGIWFLYIKGKRKGLEAE